MRKEPQAFRRRQLWRLLIGAMGGAMCAGDPWAAEPQAAGRQTKLSTDRPPMLRLSLQLSQIGKPSRRGRQGPGTAVAEETNPAPLRLTPSLALGKSGSVAFDAAAARTDAPAAVVANARPVAGGSIAARSGIGEDGGEPQAPAPVPFDPTPQNAGSRRPEQPSPSEPVPFDPAPQGAAPRRPAPEKPGGGLPDLGSETWAMAPIRWAGSSSSGGSLFDDKGSTTLSINNSLSLVANSFIVAPYIATWSSNFAMNSSRTDYTPDTGPKIRTDTTGNNLSASINVFPQSRFPFSAYFGRGSSESRQGEDEVVTTGFGFTQQYTTEDGRDKYAVSYTRGTSENGKDQSSFSNMQGSYSTRHSFGPEHFLEGEHTLNASAGYAPDTTEVNTGQGSSRLNASLSHGWVVHQDLRIDNQLSLVSDKTSQYLGNSLSYNDSTIFLGSSNFSWRPDEDLPLTVSGGANFGHTQTQTSANGDTFSQQFFSANVSGSYIYSNQLSFSAGASLATVSADSGRFSLASANIGAYYNGLPIQFGGYTYSWNVGGGAVASASTDGNSFGISTGAGHSLSREFPIDDRQSVSVSGTQSISFSNTQDNNTLTLSNSAGIGWRANYGEALSANLSATAGFSTTSDNSQSYSAALMGGGAYQISPRQSLTLSSNLNWSRTSIGDLATQNLNGVVIDSDQAQLTGAVSLNYTHTSPFSIRNLVYTADLLWTAYDSTQRIVGITSQSSGLQDTLSFTQLARYRVGRLNFNLSAAVINGPGGRSTSVYGQVTREFDGFFDGRW